MWLINRWLLCLLLLSAGAIDACAEPPVLRLVADSWPPFSEQWLPNNGLASDLVVQALGRAGYHSQYVETSWARALHGLERGDYDVLVNAWYSQERSRFGHFSAPYLHNRIRLLKRKGYPVSFTRIADLTPHRIAGVRGYAYHHELLEHPDIERVDVNNFVSALGMLNAERVELVMEDEQVIYHYLGPELNQLEGAFELVDKPLGVNGLHILVSLQNPQHKEIVRGFEHALEQMKQDGSYQATLQRHGL